MPRDGSGNYTLPAGNPVVTGTIIDVNWANPTLSDVALQLNNVLTRDGLLPATGPLPMGANKIANLGVGSLLTDSITLGQVQNSTVQYLTAVAGTNDFTATLASLAAYTAGQTFRFVAPAANTGAATININGLGVKSITKSGAVALVGAEIATGSVVQISYDGTQFQLLAGAGGAAGGATGGGTDAVFYENDLTINTNYTIGSAAYRSGVTISLTNPALFTLSGHNLAAEMVVHLSTTGALPTGFAVDTPYYVIATGLTSSVFQLSATLNGTGINASGAQSGVHSVGKIKNAVSAGPVGIATGVTVTVPTGATWSIV